MRLFNGPSTRAQLIFNTHDTNLLNGSLLRRDQIWFTEKKPDGSSSLYPLTDFSPRQHENLEGRYLQGRYGGVPFLNPDGLSKLVGRGDDGN
jgi:AAA15 family ATPase/GTPase